MIKKTITYDNYDDESVTDTFHFSINKLEAMEMEMEFDGGLEGHLRQLQETSDGREAYRLFKDIILKAIGKKSADGKRFMKNDEIREEFEQSNALGELILELIQDAQQAATFIENCLPNKLIKEAKAAAATRGVNTFADSSPEAPVELPTAPPVLEETQTEAPSEEKIDGKTDEEILKLKPQDMTPNQLMRAYQLKSTIQ